VITITLYVDDIILISNGHTLLKQVKAMLLTEFEILDYGNFHYCHGIQIFKDGKRKMAHLNHGKKNYERLKRFGMER
jgi:hypothetical protein